MPFLCAPKRTPMQKRPSGAFLSKKLKKRMDSGASRNEGKHTFDTRGLVPLITFAVELSMKYLPENHIIREVVHAYVTMFGETSVRLFLEEHVNWIDEVLTIAFDVVLV